MRLLLIRSGLKRLLLNCSSRLWEDVMDQLKAGILNDDIAAILKESAKQ